MYKIQKRLQELTSDVLNKGHEDESTLAQIKCLGALQKAWKQYNAMSIAMPNNSFKIRLDALTKDVLAGKNFNAIEANSYEAQLKTFSDLISTWNAFGNVEIDLDEDRGERDEDRKSSREWDRSPIGLTTKIPLTEKQREALMYLDDDIHDKVLLLGGSGSGKSFIEVYKQIRDALRHKAPCLIARDKMIDLTQGMIDQIVPTILGMIAKSNRQDDWKVWTIDGLKFAKWTDKKSKLEFATGGYIRFAGLSARDLSESGSDKILSPSWFHVMLEEISELEYEIVEKILTRLRHNVPGQMNKLMMCENPPSINHWSYRRFFERKRSDGTEIGSEEMAQHVALQMNPVDNVENLGEKYIQNLKQMSGANYERFYLGAFQDQEQGEIFKYMDWVTDLPRNYEWDKLCIYCDPTPLTTNESSIYADYKASVLVGLYGVDKFVLDVRLVKGSTMHMLRDIKQLWEASPNKEKTTIYMENKGVPDDFDIVWKKFSADMKWYVPIHRDKRKFGDKKQSIEMFLQPEFESNLMHFNKKFQGTERGKQAEFQIKRFSRKKNKNVHDDIPDAIMKAVTILVGQNGKNRKPLSAHISFVKTGLTQRKQETLPEWMKYGH